MSFTPSQTEDPDPLPSSPETPERASQEDLPHEEAFALMTARTLAKKPTLSRIFDEYKGVSMWDYYDRMETTAVKMPRSQDLLNAIHTEAKRLFGQEDADGIVAQLKTAFQVSTTEHHGLFAPIDWLGSTFSRAIYNQKKHPERAYHIGLVCSNVSLNNISFPRGILFHGDQNRPETDDGLLDLVFYSSKHGKDTLYGLPALPVEEFEDLVKQINAMASKQELSKEARRVLQELIDTIFLDPKLLTVPSFADQMALVNVGIWDRLWGERPHSKLIYLEQETIASRLLIDHHLFDQSSYLNHVLFDPEWEPFVNQAFDGIDGAFCSKDFCGSYMFWAIPEGKQHRVCLIKNGNKLQTRDGKYEIDYTPEKIAAALERKELMPTLLMTFMTLSFYYGLEVIGGGNQVNYLTKMRDGLIWVLEQVKQTSEIEQLKTLRTDLFSCDLLMGLINTPEGGGIPTSLDLLLYEAKDWVERAEANMKVLPIQDSFEPSIPGYYQDYAEDYPALPNVSIEEAARWMVAHHQLQPLGDTQIQL